MGRSKGAGGQGREPARLLLVEMLRAASLSKMRVSKGEVGFALG